MSSEENLAPTLLGVFVTGAILSTISVALRLWVRGWIVRKVGLDDWVVLCSLFLVYGSLGCVSAACAHGLGKHISTLEPSQAIIAVKMEWVAFQLTPSAEATAKISITIMLIRITTSKRWKWFFISLIVAFVAMTIWTLFALLMSCWPIQKLWDFSVPGSCNVTERTVNLYFQGITAAMYDFILGISPILLLWSVHISTHTKMLLCGLLALSLFTCGAGIARTTYTWGSGATDDPTWNIMGFLIWKCVELPLSIIVGCLPTLRPLFDGKSLGIISSKRTKETSYVLSESTNDRIRKTVEVEVHSGSFASESRLNKHPEWEVEDVV